ncbi:MAG: N-acetylmuramoyl-L-alanine amidase [Betaproteobacteria bacterium]|nr:N-acetylmuramoyl-L-alanine amidase [Betaproteobacteria bacterium]
MRRALAALITCWLACLGLSVSAVEIKAARVWPSPEYTRITIELDDAVTFKQFQLKNPERVVLDLEGVQPESMLVELATRVPPQDAFIAGIRVARNRPGVTRLVVEVKGEVKPQVFTLKPMAEYGHRLVLDVYPAAPPAPNKPPEDLPPAAANPETVTARLVEKTAKDAAKADAKTAEARPAGGKPAKDAAKPAYTRLITVAIDAGHGGEDPGARGANGSREKDITLSVARRLKAVIDKQPNLRAYLTRDADYFIPLHERVNKARRAQADLFMSIHADAFIKPHARGSSVFALSEKGATSAAAKWLAKRENDADLIGGINIDVKDVHLKQTLIDLSQTAQIADSLKVGRAVLDELGGINQLHKGQVEQAGFAVLKAPDIPSILVETAFISNPEEEKRLNDDDYQAQLAEAIVAGIKRYLEKNPPLARAHATHQF